MKRTAANLVAAFLLTACNERAPVPAPRPTGPAPGFDNRAAEQSIMQPKVIEESKQAPEPKPTPALPIRMTVLFAHGATLDEDAHAALHELATRPAIPANALWTVRGSSDTSGSNEANLRISRRRAEAVRDYLVSEGIDSDRVTVIALGDGRPVAPNVQLDGTDDPVGRAKNRRVEVEVIEATAASSSNEAPLLDASAPK